MSIESFVYGAIFFPRIDSRIPRIGKVRSES